MIKEADASCAFDTARDEASDKKRGSLRLVSSRLTDDDDAASAPVITLSPIHPAFMVRDERFASLHPRQVFSRLRRRGSYVFHC